MSNGYDAYKTYQAVRLHFTNDHYDYYSYNGKSKTSLETFNTRKDKYQFHKVARMYSESDLPYFFAVNFFYSEDKTWITNLLGDEAKKLYTSWVARQQARTHNLKQDLDKIRDAGKFEDMIKCNDGQFPELLNVAFQKEISYDSLIILDHFIGFLSAWNGKIQDDFIWPTFYKKVNKYKPFFLHYAPLSDLHYKKIIVKELTLQK